MTAPEPYFDDGQVQLFLGDCREILPALGVTADLVLADPPYGETSLAWDRWPEGWLQVAATVSRSLWCFGSLRMFLTHAGEFADAGWKLSQDIIWEKNNGTGMATDRFRRTGTGATGRPSTTTPLDRQRRLNRWPATARAFTCGRTGEPTSATLGRALGRTTARASCGPSSAQRTCTGAPSIRPRSLRRSCCRSSPSHASGGGRARSIRR